MPDTQRTWTERICEKQLPMLEATAARLTPWLQGHDVANADLARMIGDDPGANLAITRQVCAGDRQQQKEVSGVAHAVSLIGTERARGSIRSLSVLENPTAEKSQNGIYLCYSKAMHAASYARHWSQERKESNPESIGQAALLSHCGELLLWAHESKIMQQIEQLVSCGLDQNSAATKILGATLSELSGELAYDWNLPPLVSETPFQWQFLDRPLMLHLSSRIADSTTARWNSEETEELIEFLAELWQTTKDVASAKLHQQAVTTASTVHELKLPVAAVRLISPLPVPAKQAPPVSEKETPSPEKEPDSLPVTESANDPALLDQTQPLNDPAIQKVPAEPSPEKAAAPSPPVDPPTPKPQTSPVQESKAPSSPDPQPKPKEPLVQESTTPLPPDPPPAPKERPVQKNAKPPPSTPPPQSAQKKPKPTKPDLRQQFARTMQTMHKTLPLQQVMFAAINTERGVIVARYVIGADQDAPIRRFSLPLKSRHLFSMLLQKPQSLWLGPGNREKYIPLIPSAAIGSLDTANFFAASLFKGEKPLGFIYGASQPDKPLNGDRFRRFKQLVHKLNEQMK